MAVLLFIPLSMCWHGFSGMSRASDGSRVFIYLLHVSVFGGFSQMTIKVFNRIRRIYRLTNL